MSKVLVIPDVHLKPVIFDRAEKILKSGQADFAVSLGDLFDDFGEEWNTSLYERTAQRALAFHKDFPKTLWCMGNHDFGYYYSEFGRMETGHSVHQENPMAKLLLEFTTQGIFQKVCHKVDNVAFSHAGITESWMRTILLDYPDQYDFGDYVEILINNYDADSALLWDQDSPIWARPQDATNMVLFSDKMQVVGHTPMKKITLSHNGKLLSTDVFSTYNNGAPYGERRFAIVDTEKMTWEYAKEDDE